MSSSKDLTMHRASSADQNMNETMKEREKVLLSIKKDFQGMRAIKPQNCFRSYFCCLWNYKKMLLKSQSSLGKELDLRKFIYR